MGTKKEELQRSTGVWIQETKERFGFTRNRDIREVMLLNKHSDIVKRKSRNISGTAQRENDKL